MKRYQYAILFNPKNDDDKKEREKSAILVQPTTIIANDDKSALILASRSIPDSHVDRLSEVKIAIWPSSPDSVECLKELKNRGVVLPEDTK